MSAERVERRLAAVPAADVAGYSRLRGEDGDGTLAALKRSGANRALGRNASLPALRLKLSLLGHLGRREEASECLRRLRETHAEPTVAALIRAGSKGASLELAACIAEGLCKAGVPEG